MNNLPFLMMVFSSSGKKYYVSSVSGSNSNPGTEAEPFLTLNYARAFIRPNKGDTLFLERGSVFHEQYELVDKQKMKPCGSGARPKITGADALANASFSLTSGKIYTYEISLPSIPSTSNTYVSLTCSDVLMTWENNVRMGGRFENNATSIATVESTAGSQWWDSAAKKLYIHPADNGNPISNGKTYEASTRTLCLHGGDAFYVEGIDSEKSYAKTQTGQQGYQLLGYKGGTYYKCSAKYSWNHNAGVANAVETNNELLFDHCLFENMENISSVAGTLFVAYKNGLASAARVRTKNCVAKQPSRHATIQNTGFYSHGNSIAYTSENDSAENCYYGLYGRADAATSSTFSFVGVFTGVNNLYGVRADSPGNYSLKIKTTESGLSGINVRSPGVSVSSSWFNLESTGTGVGSNTGSTEVVAITNSVFAASTNISSLNQKGVEGLSGGVGVSPQNCIFYNIGNPMSYHMENSNNNIFYHFVRVVNNADAWNAPGYFTTLAAWQAASGQDLHSTAPGSAPTLPDGFWDIAIPDVLAA